MFFLFLKHELCLLAKTDALQSCEQYTTTKLVTINQQWNECNSELAKHVQLPMSILRSSLETLDSCLRKYVCLQQQDLLKFVDNRLVRCQSDIDDQQLYRQLLSGYLLTSAQQEAISHLIHLRQIHLKIYEEFVTLKERILLQFLPRHFDQLEEQITPEYNRPPVVDHILADFKTKRRRILQQAKRSLLSVFAHAYEFKIQECEQEYQQALIEVELNLAKSTMLTSGLTPFHSIKAYMTHHTNRIKQEIHHKISHFNRTIARRRHRSKSAKKTTGICPQVTIDVVRHPMSSDELAYLSRGTLNGCLIEPCHRFVLENVCFFLRRKLYPAKSECTPPIQTS